MKKMIAAYKAMVTDISEEVKDGMLSEKDTLQVLRADKPVFQDYRPIIDWYYDAFAMEEEFSIPIEQMYMEDEFSKEEWAQMKADHAAYKKQYEEEKDRLESISVKAVLTEMKQMQKLFGK